MKKYFVSNVTAPFVVVILSVFFLVATVQAATTISTNVQTDGTIDAASFINTSGGYKMDGNLILQASSTRSTLFVGQNTGNSRTTGTTNIGVGHSTLSALTTGSQNTALGYQTLNTNTTGTSNTAVGYNALVLNTSGNNNVAIGNSSLPANTTGAANVGVGYNALKANTTGATNIAMGQSSLFSNTTGLRNIGIGHNALFSNSMGLGNIGIGYLSLYELTTSASTGFNVAIGYNTGRGITTGVNNTILGANVTGLPATLSNNIVIADGSGNRRINVSESGNTGIGVTSPTASLEVATSTSNATTTVVVGKNGQKKGSCLVLYDAVGTVQYVTVQGGTLVVSSVSCR